MKHPHTDSYREDIDASQPPSFLLSLSIALSGTTYVCQILSSFLMSVHLKDSLILHWGILH